MIYDNAETEKSKILSDNKGKPAIYLWRDKKSGKIYIGSAVDLSKRMHSYYSTAKLKKLDNIICRSLLHHGHEAFSLTIIEYIYISNLTKEDARKLILEREQYYLDLLQPDYNILKIAGNSLGYKHTADSLAKMSEAQKGKNHPFHGKSHSEETKAKLSLAKIGDKNPMSGRFHTNETKALMSGRFLTDETKALMSIAKKGEDNPNFGKSFSTQTIAKMSVSKGGGAIFVCDAQGSLAYTFHSARKAAEFFDCSPVTILKYTKNNELFKKKW